MPRRTRTHAPVAASSHDVLCRIVIRRHGRRAVLRIDRPLCVFLGRRISAPCLTRGTLPPTHAGYMEAIQSLALDVLAVAMAAARQLVLGWRCRRCNRAVGAGL